MYALISPNETQLGYSGQELGTRVAQIEETTFPVAEPLFWKEIDISLDVEGILYYDNGVFKIEPKSNMPVGTPLTYTAEEVEI
jgi:hypothetical protein